jgi:D-alanyl-D-alanine dipeptidase
MLQNMPEPPFAFVSAHKTPAKSKANHRERKVDALRKISVIALAALLVVSAAVYILYTINTEKPATPAPTASPVPAESIRPTPSETPAPTPEIPRAQKYEGDFELPINGATGYATITLNLRSGPSSSSEKLDSLEAGAGFRIIRQENSYWYVTDGSRRGYVAHRYCMINLPDIIPSIVYDNTNSYSSLLRSSGKALPGVTGEALYKSSAYNSRLGQQEFIMPVLYEMAPKIYAAQQAALRQGNSLKIYEAYRPHSAQRKAVDALNTLAEKDAAVLKGISTPPWKVSWFASQGTSHHQRGVAIDVSLVKVTRTEELICGPYLYTEVRGCSEYKMPTAMHELSIAAAAFSKPVSSTSSSAWRGALPASAMNDAALALQKYCTDAGLTPLASEWWHFNDLAAYGRIKNNAGQGGFVLTELYSRPPES